MTKFSSTLTPIIDAVRADQPQLLPFDVRDGQRDSNHVFEVLWFTQRRLVVKRARYEWDRERFRAARLASRLLSNRTGVIVPRPLDVPEEMEGRAVEVYWRIELPTLRETWPMLGPREQECAVRSWGALLRRIHKVRLSGFGRLPTAAEEHRSLSDFMTDDIASRLTPAIAAWWPQALQAVTRLGADIPRLATRVRDREPSLLHNDPHCGNVLCSDERRWRCVGVLDLEACIAGPAESDIAHAELLHGPLFGYHIEGRWSEWLRDGYGQALDPYVLAFYRAYHLLNLGWHAAFTGDAQHARDVLCGVNATIEQLE